MTKSQKEQDSAAQAAWERLRAAIVWRFDHPGLKQDAAVGRLSKELCDAMGEPPTASNVVSCKFSGKPRVTAETLSATVIALEEVAMRAAGGMR